MSWRDVQDAMQAAIAQAGRLDPSQVIWSFQNVDEPQLPFVRLAMPTIISLGQDFEQVTQDLTRPAGQEIKIQPQGQREVPLELQGFTASTADENAAVFLVEQIKTAIRLPSIKAGLTALGVSLFDPGPVQNVPEVVNVGFRGRATCTLRMYAPAQALAEYVGYISTVNGQVTTSGGGNPSLPALPFQAKLP